MHSVNKKTINLTHPFGRWLNKFESIWGMAIFLVQSAEARSWCRAVAGERRGTSPSYAGDVDGDGIGDLISGARQNNEGALKGRKVYRHNGVVEGKLLRPWTSRRSGDTLGFDATGIGDPIGDGKIDFLLTSAWARRRVRRQDGFLSSREENVKTEPSK